jgi:hypothetical protein
MTEANDNRDKPRSRLRWYVLISLGLLLVAAVVAGISQRQYARSLLASDLKRLTTRLDETDPNWRLEELLDAREPIPEAQNSAGVVERVHSLLPKGGWPPRALDNESLGISAPVHRLDDQAMKALLRELGPCAAAIREARRLADLPRGLRVRVASTRPLDFVVADFSSARSVTSLLHYDVLRLAQEGDLRQAVRSCRAALNAARSQSEPFGIPQLVRIACIAIACNALERTLAQGEPDPDELALVQQLLTQEDSHRTLRELIRGERACADATLEGLANGTVPLSQVIAAGKESGSWWPTGPSRSSVRREHPFLLRTMTRFLETTDLPEHEQLAALEALSAEIDRDAKKNPVSAQLTPSLSTIARACFRKTAQVRAMLVAVALERHRQQSGKWADRLDDLVPAFLEKVPLDPYDGKPLRYARWAEGVVVYSVGEDRIDNGGEVVAPGHPPRGLPADTGYRLWDVAKRGQPPLPRPPEEPELLPEPVPEGGAPLPGGK